MSIRYSIQLQTEAKGRKRVGGLRGDSWMHFAIGYIVLLP